MMPPAAGTAGGSRSVYGFVCRGGRTAADHPARTAAARAHLRAVPAQADQHGDVMGQPVLWTCERGAGARNVSTGGSTGTCGARERRQGAAVPATGGRRGAWRTRRCGLGRDGFGLRQGAWVGATR